MLNFLSLALLGWDSPQVHHIESPQDIDHSLRLPPELVRYTLQNFTGITDEDRGLEYRLSVRTITSACLVCHHWNSIATPLLYLHPKIGRVYSLRLLAHTVTTSPPLSDLVRSLVISLDGFHQAGGGAYYVTRWRSVQNSQQVENEDHLMTFVFRILHACSSLENLYATFMLFSSSSLAIGLNTMKGPWITSRLRSLTVNLRVTLDLIFTNLAFPLLEVLYLIYVPFERDLKFHPLPRVHSLRILGDAIHPITSGLDGPALRRLFPSLRTYDILQGKPYSPVKDVVVSSNLGHLDHLCLLDTSGVHPFYTWAEHLVTMRARDLTLGVFKDWTGYRRDLLLELITGSQREEEPHNDHPSIESWVLPPSVEHLTLLVDLVVGQTSISLVPLERILQFLEKNAENNALFSLRKLRIVVIKVVRPQSVLPMEGYRDTPVVQAISGFCNVHQIRVEIGEQCKFNPRPSE